MPISYPSPWLYNELHAENLARYVSITTAPVEAVPLSHSSSTRLNKILQTVSIKAWSYSTVDLVGLV